MRQSGISPDKSIVNVIVSEQVLENVLVSLKTSLLPYLCQYTVINTKELLNM